MPASDLQYFDRDRALELVREYLAASDGWYLDGRSVQEAERAVALALAMNLLDVYIGFEDPNDEKELDSLWVWSDIMEMLEVVRSDRIAVRAAGSVPDDVSGLTG